MMASPESRMTESTSTSGSELASRVGIGAAVGGSLVLYGALRGGSRPPLGVSVAFVVAGAVVGFVFHLTRAWRARGSVRTLLRWVLGGTVAGVLVTAAGVFGEPVSAFGLFAGGVFGALMTAHLGWLKQHVDPNPNGVGGGTPAERRVQLAIVLALAGAAAVLLSLASPTT